MRDTIGKADGHDVRPSFPNPIGIALVEGAESMLHAQVGLLTDIEESVIQSLRAQQEALKKTLELVDGMRDSGSVLDHVRMQLSVSERWLNSGFQMWRDAANTWSQMTVKRFDPSRGNGNGAAAHERREAWDVVEKSAAAPKTGSRRAAAEAA